MPGRRLKRPAVSGECVIIRYAIIGSGMMGQEHIRNLRLLDGAEVTAVCDPFEPMRDKGAALAGPGTRKFADVDSLLAADIADALVIASPNHTHHANLKAVMGSGLPILVEKPLCTTSADCLDVIAAARGRKAPVWVAMEYRYMPPLTRLIEAARGGAVGRRWMLAIREHRYPFLVKVGDWNRFSRNSGGTLVEKCCHFFDLMRLILGAEPVRLYASGGQDVNHKDERYDGEAPDILDNAYVIVDFDNGARAMLDLCMFAEGSVDQEEIAVTGDAGKIQCGLPSSTLVTGNRKGELLRETVEVDPRLLEAGDHHASTYYQHVAFLACIREGRAPEVTLEDGYRAVAMGEAAERSVRTRMPVELHFSA